LRWAAGLMVLAIIRFRKIALDIDAKEPRPGTGAWLGITLVTLLVLLSVVRVFETTSWVT
jgi:uncharacterized membrane protein YidH (DUF202 family)